MTKGEIAGALRDLEGAIEREDEAAVLVALFRLAQLSLETIVSMAGSLALLAAAATAEK